jgi:outer membrane protein insertion porin family
VEGIITDVGITQTNFRGRGQDLSARISLGSIQQIADISFTEPHFLDRDLSGGFDIFGQRYDFTQYTSYTSTSIGATGRLGIALSPNLALRLNYTIRLDDIIVDDYLCVPGAQLTSIVLCDESGTYLTSLVGYTLGYNHLNDPVQPTRGYYLSLEQDLAGFGGTVHYLKDVARGGFYHGFTKDLIFSLTGSTGYIDGWNGDTIRIGDRFYMGGDTFRGFQIAGIGPRDTQYGDALGGKFYAIGTAELTIPTKLPEQYGIKLALFTDFGTEGLLDRSDKINPFTNLPITTVVDNLGFRQTVGVSIFWKSPMGPLRFNLGEPIFKQPYDKTEFFQFSTATRF